MTIMDAVTSLAGIPVLVDEWGIDAAYSGSQKCLSCTPGLSPITFSDRVVELVRGRKEKVHSWFMDLSLLLGYWGATTRTYHHTAPTNSHLRAARGAAHAAGRGTGEQLGASRAKLTRRCARGSRPSACSTWSRRSTGCRR